MTFQSDQRNDNGLAPVPATGAAPASDELRNEVLLAAEELRGRVAMRELNTQEALRLRDLLANRMLVSSPNPRRDGYLWPDGSLRIVKWGEAISGDEPGQLRVETSERPSQMEGKLASGEGLVTNGHLGADIIRCAAGGGFAPHTHIGDHLLLVIAGNGTITYDGRIYPTRPGQAYFVEGAVPHAVGAISDHVLISVGTPHRAVDAADRQAVREYESILADFESLHCDICDLHATLPVRLADLGCPHCPSQFY
jgi:quercetin dioxygenase-like cupin family protein